MFVSRETVIDQPNNGIPRNDTEPCSQSQQPRPERRGEEGAPSCWGSHRKPSPPSSVPLGPGWPNKCSRTC